MEYLLTKEQTSKIETIYQKVQNKISKECDRLVDIIPYIPVDGHYRDTDIHWWTNGFWGGILWQSYHATGDERYRQRARIVEERLDEVLYDYFRTDHDAGFLWLHTSVASYRLTRSEESMKRSLIAASVLASRFNATGGFIRAWNEPAKCSMIIDCLMNLPLLYWASEVTADQRFAIMAKRHTETALETLIREDGSCHHIAEMDSMSGECTNHPVGQGYDSGSSWSRGQSWAIYGMALGYRYTGEKRFLNAAIRTANYFIANVAMTGFVSEIDFRSPKEPKYLDTTATAIAACGLLELAQHLDEYEQFTYIQAAYNMVQALSDGHVDYDSDKDGILEHGSAKYHREIDREVKIIYGDYFLLEALLRFMGKDFLIW